VTYLRRRFLRMVLLIVGVSLLCFLFIAIAPGSFFDELRLNPQISPETIGALRAQYGLDQPLALRYVRWIAAVAHGEFGYSIAYNAPVAPLLWARAQNTLLLTVTAMLLTWLIGVPMGVLAAARPGGLLDKVLGGATSLLISIPEIVLAVALLAFAVRTRFLPLGGMRSLGFEEMSSWASFQDLLLRMLLPTSLLVVSGIAAVIRHVRSSVIEVLDTPYIQAARGLGIGPARLLFRHALPVAANPALSLFGLSLAALLSGSLLVEVVTGWPGLGPLMLEAMLARDFYVVIGGVTLSAVFMLVGNFISDLLLLACDPRLRMGSSSVD
jgi:peptide/nickel transport system permease protein